MSRRAIRKKLSGKFKVGDVITWGHGFVAHRIVEVNSRGVWVDSTSDTYGERRQGDRLWTYIPFVRERCHFTGPPRHTDMEPDKPMTPWAARQVLESWEKRK